MTESRTSSLPGLASAVGTLWHERLRPAAHAFTYPAFFLSVPVRALSRLGQAAPIAYNRRGWVSLHDRDHGPRDGTPMLKWIEGLLAQAHIADATGEIILMTVPRVLGFVFNPVSFWFCQRPDGAIRAIVCEVNNTFGERHAYLLAHADGSCVQRGEELTAQKIFHVSPFCRVEGRYRFRFDISPARAVCRIDYDDAEGALLRTALSGQFTPWDRRSVAGIVARFPFYTFAIVARIHRQALSLWLKRIPFFSKPSPPSVEVSR